jgi:hypothetical protein
MDDFIYGEPRALTPDTTPPAVTVKGLKKKLKRAKFLRSVHFSVKPSEPSSFEISLLAKAKRSSVAGTGRAVARANQLILASKSLGRSAGTRNVRLKPSKRLVGATKRFKTQLRITATDAAGNSSVVKRVIRVIP